MSKPKRVRPAMMPKCQYAAYPKQFISEVLEIYKRSPCLWRVGSEEYFDRVKKDRAYNEIIDKLQEVENFPDRKMAIELFSALRFNYRKQLKLVEEGKKPTLWYFKQLDFIRNYLYSNRKNSWGIIENDRKQSEYSGDNENSADSSMQTSIPLNKQNVTLLQLESPTGSCADLSCSSVNFEQSENVYQYEDSIVADDNEQPSAQYFEELGDTWASILRSVPSQQQIIAEKLINDIIYEGHMGKLTDQTQIDVLNILQA